VHLVITHGAVQRHPILFLPLGLLKKEVVLSNNFMMEQKGEVGTADRMNMNCQSFMSEMISEAGRCLLAASV